MVNFNYIFKFFAFIYNFADGGSLFVHLSITELEPKSISLDHSTIIIASYNFLIFLKILTFINLKSEYSKS